MRRICVFCLGLLLVGCGQEKTTSDWIEQLKDKDVAQRLQAVKVLGERGAEESSGP